MSEEDFLSRWSRRKREAEEAVKPEAPPQAEQAAVSSPATANTAQGHEPEPEEQFDLSALPPIDSITAASNITAFLRKGVPLELTRAALRRAWLADPAIRDFVGLAENAWDFNDPNAMPGFGPLDQSPEQVRQLVSQIVGDLRREAEALTPTADEHSPSEPSDCAVFKTEQPESRPTEAMEEHATTSGELSAQDVPIRSGDAATQNVRSDAVKPDAVKYVRRTHGGALPR